MPSLVDVCNRALSRIGNLRVTQVFPTPDSSKAARACHSAWDTVRDEVLRAYPWNSCISRASLPALASAPEWGYSRQFQLPADCLRVLEVNSDLPWQVEGRVVLSDESAPLEIRYLRREEDVQQWDSLLTSAMASRLAVEISRELADVSGTQQEILLMEYRALLMEARRSDAQESSTPELAEDAWITVR